MKSNPFILSGYKSPEYFCNRDLESGRIEDAIENQRNLTLISTRRMGKTGLLMHVFHQLSKDPGLIPVYFDIMGTTDLREFTEVFSNALIKSIARSESSLKGWLKKLASLRPSLSFDSVSGEPRISLDIRNESETVQSLELMFNLIAQNRRSFVVAMDEFQQISNYPEKNVEAILRSQVQQCSNLTCIFSGSKKHMLSAIFSQPSRPFFNSTEMMFLEAIEQESYFQFIQNHFLQNNRSISGEALKAIAAYTDLHTFYVQFLCNRLFSSFKKVGQVEVDYTLRQIITENDPVYASYLNLLTTTQYKVLRAIALEGNTTQPTSGSFLAQHALGAASTVSQAVESLIHKEFLQENAGSLQLQDKFFAQWIRLK